MQSNRQSKEELGQSPLFAPQTVMREEEEEEKQEHVVPSAPLFTEEEEEELNADLNPLVLSSTPPPVSSLSQAEKEEVVKELIEQETQHSKKLGLDLGAEDDEILVKPTPTAVPVSKTWRVVSGAWSWTRFGLAETAAFATSLASISTATSIAWTIGGAYYAPITAAVTAAGIFPAATVPAYTLGALSPHTMSLLAVGLVSANKGLSAYYKRGKEDSKDWFRTNLNFSKKAPEDASFIQYATWLLKEKSTDVASLFAGAAYSFAGVVSIRAISIGMFKMAMGQPLATPVDVIADDLKAAAAYTATVLIGKEFNELIVKNGADLGRSVVNYGLDKVEYAAKSTYDFTAPVRNFGYNAAAFGAGVGYFVTSAVVSTAVSPITYMLNRSNTESKSKSLSEMANSPENRTPLLDSAGKAATSTFKATGLTM